jgi:hypothetical protein
MHHRILTESLAQLVLCTVCQIRYRIITAYIPKIKFNYKGHLDVIENNTNVFITAQNGLWNHVDISNISSPLTS